MYICLFKKKEIIPQFPPAYHMPDLKSSNFFEIFAGCSLPSVLNGFLSMLSRLTMLFRKAVDRRLYRCYMFPNLMAA